MRVASLPCLPYLAYADPVPYFAPSDKVDKMSDEWEQHYEVDPYDDPDDTLCPHGIPDIADCPQCTGDVE